MTVGPKEVSRSATAKVYLLVEVPVGVWGPECTIAQATEQAEESAREELKKAIALLRGHGAGIKIVKVEKIAVTLGWSTTESAE